MHANTLVVVNMTNRYRIPYEIPMICFISSSSWFLLYKICSTTIGATHNSEKIAKYPNVLEPLNTSNAYARKSTVSMMVCPINATRFTKPFSEKLPFICIPPLHLSEIYYFCMLYFIIFHKMHQEKMCLNSNCLNKF